MATADRPLPAQLDVRPIRRDERAYERAIVEVLRLASAERGSASGHAKDGQPVVVGAFSDGRLVTACAARETPGRAAMIHLPVMPGDDAHKVAIQAALSALVAIQRERSVELLEVLLSPESEAAGVLEAAGFVFLTRLLYLRRLETVRVTANPGADDLTWVPFADQHVTLFCRALDLSYLQTLDCHQLTGIRATADVLASHRGAEGHDPSLWWVALRENEPVGVLLLTPIARQSALEVTYMGVAQPARGTKVGDALLARAVAATRAMSAKFLALAVDRANTPARNLYARWGFVPIGARDAWIATPMRTGG